MPLTAVGAAAHLNAYPWIKLHIGSPGTAGTGNAAGETDRVQASWGAIATDTISNSADLDWTSVSTTEDYTHWSAWTASSGGTCGHTGTLTANAVTAGDNFRIAAGDLDVVFAGLAS
jgi:hypothetical protein